MTGMATSGARVQLAIAPAGTGKTTAMRALAAAWDADGGTVIGLALSATAAAVLRSSSAPAPTPCPSWSGPSRTTTCLTGPEHRAQDTGGHRRSGMADTLQPLAAKLSTS